MDIVFKDKSECCGCSVCSQVCPKNAISMITDLEGFRYPEINTNLCIDCGLCRKSCPLNKRVCRNADENQLFYEVKNKNLEERMRSRSGGIFFVIAKEIIHQGGVVYGVSIDKSKVSYKRAESLIECISMQGSKYVECTIEKVVLDVYTDLTNNRKVLFSGTACQVAALYSFLRNKYPHANLNNLLTIDIVCHGVPSAKIYSIYIKFIENKYSGNISKFDFRDKCFGWDTHVESFWIDGKKYTSDLYQGLFYSNVFLRPSCGNCKFCNYARMADITIADFVGSERVNNGLNDNKGISMIMLNNSLAQEWFSKVSDHLEIFRLEKEQTTQPNLQHPSMIPKDRKMKWDFLYNNGFETYLKKYGRNDILHRLKWLVVDYPALKRKSKKLNSEK